jgi:micrococcal nuclease
MTALFRGWPYWCRAVFASLMLCLFVARAWGEGLPGTVTRVVDGDQLVLRGPGGGQQPIRMAGIDAPEPGQPYAEQAQGNLAEELTGRFVVIDVYGRTGPGQFLGKVTLGGADMNLAQVVQGMAWVDPQTLPVLSAPEQRRYMEAEATARRSGRGLWGERSPIPPWSWRESGASRPAPGGFGPEQQRE